jgi:hypothetical protein
VVTGVGNLGTLRARLYRDLETKQRPMSSMDPSRRACYAVAQTTYGVIVTSPINASALYSDMPAVAGDRGRGSSQYG